MEIIRTDTNTIKLTISADRQVLKIPMDFDDSTEDFRRLQSFAHFVADTMPKGLPTMRGKPHKTAHCGYTVSLYSGTSKSKNRVCESFREYV